MTDIGPYLDSIAVTSQVHAITGSLGESAKAGGYSAWINAVTGTPPRVIRIPGTNRAELTYTPEQVQSMTAWLDETVKGSFKKGAPPPVEYNTGELFKPWVAKRVAPIGIGAIVAGIVAGILLARTF